MRTDIGLPIIVAAALLLQGCLATQHARESAPGAPVTKPAAASPDSAVQISDNAYENYVNGVRHLKGDGGVRDYAKARIYLQAAADKGLGPAITALGWL